ncbi:heavy metal-associated isoprenylated plant protein 26 [Phtheirospermum japonicum]|uniref:Heavy metal-associated isoprenylated plant protein 26 n=1 Tax=Phtheirospermum japonicum TaxID=374723 RepID=A0A830CUV1_9LAMI|nr:heavy metal-associated isoprenylated plant protein 26 [Phtheirospermum japonicum]
MGVLGTLEYLFEVTSSAHNKHMKKKKKLKQFQTINLKIRMDCGGCELKVKKALSSLTGVKSVEINRKQHKVTVRGYVEPNKVLKKAKSTGKKVEIWPYNLVARPYALAAYDKKAPPGFVRKVVDDVQQTNTNNGGSVTRFEDSYVTNMFSDENPNACSIM